MRLSRSTPETASPLPSAQKPQPAPSLARSKPGFRQCTLLVGTLAFLKAGCATVHLRPEPGPCPEEAMKAMKQFGRPHEGKNLIQIYPDAKQLEGPNDPGIYGDGPITGRLLSREPPRWRFPDGTMLEGHLWVSAPGDRVFGRYTLARLPDGKTLPVCIELCDGEGAWGYPKLGPGPRPGTVLMGQTTYACYTDRWH